MVDIIDLKNLIGNVKFADEPESVTNLLIADIFNGILDVISQKENSFGKSLSGLISNINILSSRLDTLTDENLSDAIDNFNEVLSFLDGVTDQETLIGRITAMRNELRTWVAQCLALKQNKLTPGSMRVSLVDDRLNVDFSDWDAWQRQWNIADIYVSTSGELVGNADYVCSGFIPLNRDFPVQVTGGSSAGMADDLARIMLFDAQRRPLTGVPFSKVKGGGIAIATRDYPADACYFAVSAAKSVPGTWLNAPTREGLLHGLSQLLVKLTDMLHSEVAAVGSHVEDVQADAWDASEVAYSNQAALATHTSEMWDVLAGDRNPTDLSKWPFSLSAGASIDEAVEVLNRFANGALRPRLESGDILAIPATDGGYAYYRYDGHTQTYLVDDFDPFNITREIQRLDTTIATIPPPPSVPKVLHNRMISYNSPAGEVYSVASRMRIRNAKPGDEFKLDGIVSYKFPQCRTKGGYAVKIVNWNGTGIDSYMHIDDNNPFVEWDAERKVLKVKGDAPIQQNPDSGEAYITILVETKLWSKACGGFNEKRELVEMGHDSVRKLPQVKLKGIRDDGKIVVSGKHRYNIEIEVLKRSKHSVVSRNAAGEIRDLDSIKKEILDAANVPTLADVNEKSYDGPWSERLHHIKQCKGEYRWKWCRCTEINPRTHARRFIRVRRSNRTGSSPWEYYAVVQGRMYVPLKRPPFILNDNPTLEEMSQLEKLTLQLQEKQDPITTTPDLTLTDGVLGLTDRGQRAAFDARWLKLVGSYGDIDYTYFDEEGVSRPYGLNTLHLTYDEALEVDALGVVNTSYINSYAGAESGMRVTKARTNLPFVSGNTGAGGSSIGYSNSNSFTADSLEVVRVPGRFRPRYISGTFMALFTGKNLHTVLGTVDLIFITSSAYLQVGNTAAMENITFAGVDVNLDMSKAAKLTVASVRSMLTRSKATALTHTVHPDVYAKLIGDTTNAAAAALSEEELAEWGAVLDLAVSKNVSFATV